MEDIRRFLREDVGQGDITSETVLKVESARGRIFARRSCIVAGLEEAGMVFKALGLKPRLLKKDGDKISKGDNVLLVDGDVRKILKGERLALNFLMRMSGIATETRRLVERCRSIRATVLVSATRKTVPGFRKYDKKAVEIGGGWSHRKGLYDGVLIKDNHLKFVTIEQAVTKAKSTRRPIEVEVTSEKGALKAAMAGADIIMLDNMTPSKAKRISSRLRKSYPTTKIEISGGVTPENIIDYAKYADIISLGHLTHSVKAANFSMELKPLKRK